MSYIFGGETFCGFQHHVLADHPGLWDQGVFPHFCDTRESPRLYWGLVFGKPFLLYHRSGHFPQPWADLMKFPVGE